VAGKRQIIKRTRRRIAKPDRVISLIDLGKIDSAEEKKSAKSIVYPSPPSNLNAIAKAEWKNMIRDLHQLGRFEKLDGLALSLYCETYAEWYTAGQELKKPGQSLMLRSKEGKALYRNPWADIQKAARKEMSAYLALFGLSPYDRARIAAAGGEKPGNPRKEPNEFDGF
jgi:P27 family predicted phage terminase small subunit